jgi:hypothetical protein
MGGPLVEVVLQEANVPPELKIVDYWQVFRYVGHAPERSGHLLWNLTQ